MFNLEVVTFRQCALANRNIYIVQCFINISHALSGVASLIIDIPIELTDPEETSYVGIYLGVDGSDSSIKCLT